MIKELWQQLSKAQQRMKRHADMKRTIREFEPRTWVFLKLQPYRQKTVATRRSQKLNSRYYGPYLILEKVGEVAYCLELPATAHIHLVFHVSLLKRALSPTIEATPIPAAFGFDSAPHTIAIVSRRMVRRGRKPVTQVLIQWSNGTPEGATWEFLYDIKL